MSNLNPKFAIKQFFFSENKIIPFLSAYYGDKIGKKIEITLDKRNRTSFCVNQEEKVLIFVNYNQIYEIVNECPDISYGLLYSIVMHEIGHALHTPRGFRFVTTTLNALEDNRIEAKIEKQNMTVRFKMLRYILIDRKLVYDLRDMLKYKRFYFNEFFIMLSLTRAVDKEPFKNIYRKFGVPQELLNEVEEIVEQYNNIDYSNDFLVGNMSQNEFATLSEKLDKVIYKIYQILYNLTIEKKKQKPSKNQNQNQNQEQEQEQEIDKENVNQDIDDLDIDEIEKQKISEEPQVEQDGNEQSENKQSEQDEQDEQDGNEQDGNEQDGNEQDGNEQDGNEQDGNEQDSNEKDEQDGQGEHGEQGEQNSSEQSEHSEQGEQDEQNAEQTAGTLDESADEDENKKTKEELDKEIDEEIENSIKNALEEFQETEEELKEDLQNLEFESKKRKQLLTKDIGKLVNSSKNDYKYHKYDIPIFTSAKQSEIHKHGIILKKQGKPKEFSPRLYARKDFLREPKFFERESEFVKGKSGKSSTVIFYLDISGSMELSSIYGKTRLKIMTDYMCSFYDKMHKYINIKIYMFGEYTYEITRNELDYYFLADKVEGHTRPKLIPFKQNEQVIIITDGAFDNIHEVSENYKEKAFFVVIEPPYSAQMAFERMQIKNKIFVNYKDMVQGFNRATESIKKLLQ